MTSKPIISVVIPVYQAQSTILRCLDSIVCHNAPIEIICVDDGSKDNSLQVLEDYAQKDKRLKVFHHENAGAGATRNEGIRNAQGDYIMFCDADDVYLPNTIDIVVEDIAKYGFDYLVFHRRTVLLDGGTNYWGGKRETVSELKCNWSEYLNNFMIQRGHGGVVVNKVFRKDIIQSNNITFEKFKFGEDWWFNLTYLVHCNKFVEDYRAYYQQFQSEGSICMKSYENYLDLNMEYMKAYQESFPEYAAQIKPFFANHFYGVLSWSIARAFNGIDKPIVGNKRDICRLFFQREDVKEMIDVYLDNKLGNRINARNAQLMQNESYCLYLMHNYYLPKIKRSKIFEVLYSLKKRVTKIK